MSTEKKADATSEALLFLQKLGVAPHEIKLVVPMHKWYKIENELKKEENKKFKDIIEYQDVKVKPPIGQF